MPSLAAPPPPLCLPQTPHIVVALLLRAAGYISHLSSGELQELCTLHRTLPSPGVMPKQKGSQSLSICVSQEANE